MPEEYAHRHMSSSRSLLTILAIFSVCIVSSQNVTTPTTCDDVDNCDARGVCTTDDDGDFYCICDDGYATYPEVDENDADRVYCNYEQKKQLTAFLLSWFLGAWGGGQWYLGLTGLAVGKLCAALGVCCIIPCCIACVAGGGAAAGSDGLTAVGGGIGSCLMCCATLGIFAWWLVDIIRFGMNVVDDSNGVSLESW